MDPTFIILFVIYIVFLVCLFGMASTQMKRAKENGQNTQRYLVLLILSVIIPFIGVIYLIILCAERSKNRKYIKPKRAVIRSNTKKANNYINANDDIFTIISDGICPPDPQKNKGDKVMDNNFNIKDYFRKDYGLPPKPPVFQLKGWLKLLYILIIPIIIKAVYASRRAQWENNYSIRNKTWHAKYDEFYNKFVEDMNIKETAMAKLSLDSVQFDAAKDGSGVEPIEFSAKAYSGYWRKAPDGIFRTDVNEYTWIFFTVDQILTYTVRFSLTGDPLEKYSELRKRYSKQEFMNEIFYNDIVSVYTKTSYMKLDESTSYEKTDKEEKKDENDVPSEEEEVKTESFNIVVPGNSISYSFIGSQEKTASLKGMKNLIRKKKMESEVKELKDIENTLNNIAARMVNQNN